MEVILLKNKRRTSRTRWNAGYRFMASVLLVTVLLTLNPVPARAWFFDDISDDISDVIDYAKDKVKSLTQATVVPFLKEGLSKLGLDTLYRKAQDAVSFISDTAEGRLPMVETMMQGMTQNVKNVAGSAVSELSKVTEVLTELQVVTEKLYQLVSSIPFNFDKSFSVNMPDGGTAIVRAMKKDFIIDVTFCIQGEPGTGIQAVFGISNASPLGDGNAAHFANEANKPMVFMDVTRNGRSYLHGRLPVLPGSFPYLTAEDYITLHNGQMIQVKVGMLDETAIEVEFGVSVEGTCDYLASASIALGASVSLKVHPNHANDIVFLGTNVLMAEIRKFIEGGESLTIENAAIALHKVLNEMDRYGREHADALGEATVGISLEGGLGLYLECPDCRNRPGAGGSCRKSWQCVCRTSLFSSGIGKNPCRDNQQPFGMVH